MELIRACHPGGAAAEIAALRRTLLTPRERTEAGGAESRRWWQHIRQYGPGRARDPKAPAGTGDRTFANADEALAHWPEAKHRLLWENNLELGDDPTKSYRRIWLRAEPRIVRADGSSDASAYDLASANHWSVYVWSDDEIRAGMIRGRLLHGDDSTKPLRASYFKPTLRKAREFAADYRRRHWLGADRARATPQTRSRSRAPTGLRRAPLATTGAEPRAGVAAAEPGTARRRSPSPRCGSGSRTAASRRCSWAPRRRWSGWSTN